MDRPREKEGTNMEIRTAIAYAERMGRDHARFCNQYDWNEKGWEQSPALGHKANLLRIFEYRSDDDVRAIQQAFDYGYNAARWTEPSETKQYLEKMNAEIDAWYAEWGCEPKSK